jgi:hypothetical protein
MRQQQSPAQRGGFFTFSPETGNAASSTLSGR